MFSVEPLNEVNQAFSCLVSIEPLNEVNQAFICLVSVGPLNEVNQAFICLVFVGPLNEVNQEFSCLVSVDYILASSHQVLFWFLPGQIPDQATWVIVQAGRQALVYSYHIHTYIHSIYIRTFIHTYRQTGTCSLGQVNF